MRTVFATVSKPSLKVKRKKCLAIKSNLIRDLLGVYWLNNQQEAVLENWDMSLSPSLPSKLWFLSLRSKLGSEHVVLSGSRRSLMFYSAVPMNAMGTAQPCPVPSLTRFLGSICPCLRVPLVISPGWHVSPLAHCLVFWCETASCTAAFIHQPGWRWRDEYKQKKGRQFARSGLRLFLCALLSFPKACMYLVSFELWELRGLWCP